MKTRTLILICCLACCYVFSAAHAQECAREDEGRATQKRDKKEEGEQAVKDDRFPDGVSHDFGRVPRHFTARHVFRFVNNSSFPVHLAAGSSMGAMRTELTKTVLRPKEEVALIVYVDARRFVGNKWHEAWINTYKNDTKHELEKFIFTIGCTSAEDCKVDPKVMLQLRLMQAAISGYDRERKEFPYYPGEPAYYGKDSKTLEIDSVLKEGAKINGPDPSGRTALMYASEFGLVENVKKLLARGADATVKMDVGWTALTYAEFANNYRVQERREIARILQEHLSKKP